MDSILNKSIPTILRQIVKFEGKGELSSKYGIVDHGQVSVEWIPTSFKDTLYARLYNVDGKIMKEAKFYGDTQINVMTENASVERLMLYVLVNWRVWMIFQKWNTVLK